MFAIYVNEDHMPYANWIVSGLKTIETRNKNMLGKIVGERVAIIATAHKGYKRHDPCIIGYATIAKAEHVTQDEFELYREETMIGKEDPYNCDSRGKWLYFMEDPCAIYPTPLPRNVIKHGRSYAEIIEED